MPSPVAGSISSGMHEPTCAEMHAVLLLALAPERDPDVADAHRLGDARAPALLEPRSQGGFASTRLAGDQNPPDARAPQVGAACGGPLQQVRSVRRRQHGRFGPKELDRPDEPLGVPRADRDVTQADPVERGQGGAGDERPGVVGRHDALPGRDTGGRIAARRAGDPVVEIAGGQGDVARGPRGAARRVDPHDVRAVDAQVCANGVLLRRGRLQLGLLGQGELGDVGEPACVVRRAESELLPVERRALDQVRELQPVGRVVEHELLVPGARLDLRVEHHSAGGAS